MRELSGHTPEGIGYTYFRCTKCGEEMVNRDQLHNVAQKYRAIRNYHIKLSKWGLSLGLRIPKEIVERYHLQDSEEIILVPEKEGFKLVPAP